MEHPSPLERFLSRLRRRSALSEREAEAILALDGRLLDTAAREVLVRPGQTVDEACLVVRGMLARFDQLCDGTRQITALHIPGDMCDLHSVAFPHAGWGIAALPGSTTLQIPHRQLLDLIRDYPGIALAFWRDTVADASILAKHVAVLGRRKAKARLAHLICGMGLRMEQAGLGTRTRFSLPLTQAQLADVLGLTLTRVHSCLTALQRERRIDRQGSQIEVIDLPYLENIAQFDRRYLLLEDSEKPLPDGVGDDHLVTDAERLVTAP